jgi:IstB-like ATP binding protein
MSRGKHKTNNTTIVEPIYPLSFDDVKVIKTATCPSSSGRSELTYQLGCDLNQLLYIKLEANSNNGYFNAEWTSMNHILFMLSEAREPFSTHPLIKVFEGKSVNTPHFLAAALLAEGFLIRDARNSRYFRLGDVDGFMERAQALIQEAMVIKPTSEPESKPESKSKPKALARVDGTLGRVFHKMSKTDVLVIDDWGLNKLTTEQRRDILELMEDRYDLKSTIITSQLPIDQWHESIGDTTLADAILDRLVHNAYKIKLEGESLRKKTDLTER